MRKRQMDFVKEMIDILERAHESTYKALSVNSYNSDSLDSITNLLTGCQTTAINIGNLIEESEGEGFITVKFLEDYCELVYSINEELRSSGSEINPEKISKKLNKMLLKIENSIKHDIPLKREAVFLPYKASMWDSLESVWEAADADPDCDAYVIPIPYFDKNPDGSLREEHYEADLFPKDVPITHYSEYDFGQHHPDMIFIHNPYDYGNLVTTIHPFFYAENMKKVTDCLVYIPYFATSGGMSRARAWCPVYDYVDYIVIQHESYRNYYSADIPDEKFLPLGSPKFDKVIRKSENPPEPPQDWKNKIEGKRVYFYNTSLSGMLQDTPQFMRKMQYVFEIFKRHKNCCLLWRPHPLFESTLYAMRPECIEVFDALKRDFLKQENWIYDDTPSVEDTIAICDEYIGDSASSVVALFGVAGKPIFILDNRIIDTNNSSPISRLLLANKNYSIDNNPGITYALTDENILYKCENDDMNYERYLDFSSISFMSAYSTIYKYKSKLILAPCLRQNIVIIDAEKKVEYLYLTSVANAEWAFEETYLIGNKLVLVPHDYPALVIIDLDTKEINYIEEIYDFIKRQDGEDFIYGSSWVVDSYINITDPICSKYLRINVNTLKCEVVEMNLNILCKRIVTVENEKDVCWIFHINGPYVTRFDFKINEGEIIDLKVEGLEANSVLGKDKYYFNDLVKVGEDYLFSPLFANMVVRLNYANKKIEGVNIEGLTQATQMRSMGYFINKNGLFYNYSSGRCFDLSGDEIKEVDVNFNKTHIIEDLRKFKNHGNAGRYCNIEKDLNNLDDYLRERELYLYDYKEQINEYKNVNVAVEGNSGELIYSKICSVL